VRIKTEWADKAGTGEAAIKTENEKKYGKPAIRRYETSSNRNKEKTDRSAFRPKKKT
jgi:hypothetical protein